MTRTTKLTLIVLAIVAAIALIGLTGGTTEVMEQAQYCEMVQQYEASGGEMGWPDYNHNYATVCKGN